MTSLWQCRAPSGSQYLMGRRWLGGRRAQGESDGKGRTHPDCALHREVPAHEAGEATADRQPQTSTAVRLAGAALHLAKFFKDALERLLGDTTASICHHYGDLPIAASGRHGNGPCGGSLHGIAQEIDQDLLHFVLIRDECGQVGLDLLHQTDLFTLDQRLHGAQTHLDEGRQGKLDGMELYPPGLDLREVEDVVN